MKGGGFGMVQIKSLQDKAKDQNVIFSREDILEGIKRMRDRYSEMAEQAVEGIVCYTNKDRWNHSAQVLNDILKVFGDDEK